MRLDDMNELRYFRNIAPVQNTLLMVSAKLEDQLTG
jgi:hypothetical protein